MSDREKRVETFEGGGRGGLSTPIYLQLYILRVSSLYLSVGWLLAMHGRAPPEISIREEVAVVVQAASVVH